MGQTVTSPLPDYRARLFRQFAADAIHIAGSMPDNARRAQYFLSMAARWHALALEAELVPAPHKESGGAIGEIQPAVATPLPASIQSFG